MKKYLAMVAMVLAAFFMAACNNKPKEMPKAEELPFVTQTKENLKKWIDQNAINPEDFKVSNYEVVWKTDSLCIINFRAIGENGFGGHVKNEFQYLNIKVDGVLYEWCDNERSRNGIIDCIKDGFKYGVMMKMKDKTLMRLVKDKSKAGVVFMNAYVAAYYYGPLGGGNILKTEAVK